MLSCFHIYPCLTCPESHTRSHYTSLADQVALLSVTLIYYFKMIVWSNWMQLLPTWQWPQTACFLQYGPIFQVATQGLAQSQISQIPKKGEAYQAQLVERKFLHGLAWSTTASTPAKCVSRCKTLLCRCSCSDLGRNRCVFVVSWIESLCHLVFDCGRSIMEKQGESEKEKPADCLDN